MKFTTEVEINLPREKVVELFDSPDNMPKWQTGLLSFEHVSGEAGQLGAKSKLKYKMGKREIKMIETITHRKLPDEFFGTYETKGVWNEVKNFFSETGPSKTNWRLETEFRCSGLMKLMVAFAPGIFKKQTLKDMINFKAFAENEKQVK